ncbi:MAG TPA: hypothetical protein VFH69_05025, partial [Gemmatimonadota bacterium]|nr:hypothetical protein [Gemmatimonadota bacterium]
MSYPRVGHDRPLRASTNPSGAVITAICFLLAAADCGAPPGERPTDDSERPGARSTGGFDTAA